MDSTGEGRDWVLGGLIALRTLRLRNQVWSLPMSGSATDAAGVIHRIYQEPVLIA